MRNLEKQIATVSSYADMFSESKELGSIFALRNVSVDTNGAITDISKSMSAALEQLQTQHKAIVTAKQDTYAMVPELEKSIEFHDDYSSYKIYKIRTNFLELTENLNLKFFKGNDFSVADLSKDIKERLEIAGCNMALINVIDLVDAGGQPVIPRRSGYNSDVIEITFSGSQQRMVESALANLVSHLRSHLEAVLLNDLPEPDTFKKQAEDLAWAQSQYELLPVNIFGSSEVALTPNIDLDGFDSVHELFGYDVATPRVQHFSNNNPEYLKWINSESAVTIDNVEKYAYISMQAYIDERPELKASAECSLIALENKLKKERMNTTTFAYT
ncbi:hypothetical protein AB6D11_06455 [Vibrio splendidus]